MKINDSELILNKDGSVYHLNLRPEQVAPLIITVGDQDRVAKVSQHFDRIEHRVHKREFVTHTGRIGEQRLTVLSSGIGPDNIDIVVNELDALFNIDFQTRKPKPSPTPLTFIRLGTAGGLQAEVPVDSLVASTGGIGLDGLLQFYQAPEQQQHPVVGALRAHFGAAWDFPVAPYFAPADPALIEQFSDGFYQGYTATNPGFYGPQGRQLRAAVRFPGYLDRLQQFEYAGARILNLEMETAALFGLSRLLGHRAISLSAVVANRALGQFSQDTRKAVANLIRAALDKITKAS
ncbi:MAG: nucleoside phosphorylase [Lewinellaceae bacterium]|nr:nucleoside phosphorylase [Lewinellaceae bacterium]